LAGGLQDNGDVYSVAGPGGGGPWTQLDGGDGGYNLFVGTSRKDLVQVCNSCGTNPPVRDYYWNPTLASFQGGDVIPIRNQGSSVDAKGIFQKKGGGGAIILAKVTSPGQYRLNSSNQLMYALAAVAGLPYVWGLFANDDSSDMHWEQIAKVTIAPTDQISAIGSGVGSEVFVGTNSGRIFKILIFPTNPQPNYEATINGFAPPGSITQFLQTPDTSRVFIVKGNYLLQWVGTSLYCLNVPPAPPLPNDEIIYGLALDWQGQRLWVSNQNSVFLTPDWGVHWSNISEGLPASPSCGDLRYTKPYLFLATYGRSVWHTNVG